LTEESTACPICGTKCDPYLETWVFRCPACGLQRSTLAPDLGRKEALDEAAREEALRELRRANFARVLAMLRRARGGSGGRLLDVGCAHGWFLRQAREAGFDALGLEPDPEIAGLAAASGVPVRAGSFPEALAADEVFDVVVFNDVLEHLPDAAAALERARRHLAPGGTLLINLPSSSGFLYRTASLLARLGLHGPFRRLWQWGLPSPHLWYFDRAQLAALAARHGFERVSGGTLDSVSLRGLWARLTFDRTASKLKAAALYAGIVAGYPLLKLLPPDIIVELYRVR